MGEPIIRELNRNVREVTWLRLEVGMWLVSQLGCGFAIAGMFPFGDLRRFREGCLAVIGGAPVMGFTAQERNFDVHLAANIYRHKYCLLPSLLGFSGSPLKGGGPCLAGNTCTLS